MAEIGVDGDPEWGPLEAVCDDLVERGWSLRDDFVSPLLVNQLAREAREAWQDGAFRPAGVGRGEAFQLRPEVRTDQVRWLDPAECSGAQRLYLDRLEQLRVGVNRGLCLGLFEFEGHLALYPPGSYYRKHLDQFRGIGRRTLTAILYLNPDWRPEDGGQLRIYTDPERPDHYEEVLPLGGRLVTFLSARFQHEVMPSTRERLSLTGWFKTRD